MIKELLEIMLGKKLVVYRLRKYLRKLYEGYPSHYFYGYEKTEGVEKVIYNLIDDGVIIAVQSQNQLPEPFSFVPWQGNSPVFRSIGPRTYRFLCAGNFVSQQDGL